jgi:uncharacterized SAM-binding protein YcdF (DUF218 family)
MAPPGQQDEQQQERYQPLALIGVTLIALLGFAVFFLSFLVAPLAILLIFYVGFAASDRSKRSSAPPPPAEEPVVVTTTTTTTTTEPLAPSADELRAQQLAREAQYRRQSLDRAALEQSSRDAAGPRR